MAQQPKFFRKNLIDLSVTNVTITVTDAVATSTGQSFVDYMRNRDNFSGWATTGSTDAANTTIEIDMLDEFAIDHIILANHNLKSYTLKYWNGSAWTDFSTVINPTTNTETTTEHSFTSVNTSKLQLIILGTQVADADKRIRQFIVTRKILTGQFVGSPVFRRPSIDLNKRAVQTLSGKSHVTERVGSFEATLTFRLWPSDADLLLLEELHFFQRRGFLFWPCGGDDDQFKYKRIGWRKEDIYLCAITSEWTPEFDNGVYANGVNMTVKLVEVI